MSFVLHEDGLPPGLTKESVEAALARSLDSWNAPKCSSLKLEFGGWVQGAAAAMDGQNSIAWVSDWSKRGFPKDARGNTNVQYRGSADNWRIGEADVFLNAAGFAWSSEADGGALVEAVLTHELGHALGLLHPCEPDGQDGAPVCDESNSAVTETTMYPFYSPQQTSLADDDIAGLCYLYGAPDTCASCGDGETCVEGGCRATCGDAMCAEGQVCGFWGCAAPKACLERECENQACDSKVASACGPLATCQHGKCVKGTTGWGDACASSAECRQGACLKGTCQPDCTADSECGPLGHCEATDDGAKACVDSGRYDEGSTCASGADCSSHICIFMGKRAQCTSECGTAPAAPAAGPPQMACLKDWSCRSVDKKDVCVPPNYQSSGGCSVGRVASGVGASPWLLLAALGTMAHKRRRTRRRSALA